MTGMFRPAACFILDEGKSGAGRDLAAQRSLSYWEHGAPAKSGYCFA